MQPKDLELLVTLEMPFGKLKGKIIADLPGNYLHWFAREGFPPGEIGRLLELTSDVATDALIMAWFSAYVSIMHHTGLSREEMPMAG